MFHMGNIGTCLYIQVVSTDRWGVICFTWGNIGTCLYVQVVSTDRSNVIRLTMLHGNNGISLHTWSRSPGGLLSRFYCTSRRSR